MPPASVFAFPAISVTAFSTDAFSGDGPPQVLIDDFIEVHAFILLSRGMTVLSAAGRTFESCQARQPFIKLFQVRRFTHLTEHARKITL
jgi:hypothetical protein